MSQYIPDERNCEAHFQNVRRDSEGRFIVKLPINNEKFQQLRDLKEIATRRFLNLERLSILPSMYVQYRKFMQEYISLNHMRLIILGSNVVLFILSHGKETSITIQLVVLMHRARVCHIRIIIE